VFIIGLLNIGFFGILSAYAQIAAATTRVTILVYTMPIWAVLLAWAVLRERPNARQALAIVLCALGLAVLIYPLAKDGVPLGLLLAVAAGTTWGAGTVYVKWTRLELDPLAVTFWQLVIAFLVIAGCLIAVDGRFNVDHAHTGSMLAAAFAGILGSGVAYAMHAMEGVSVQVWNWSWSLSWARELTKLGHQVQLMPAKDVKAYVKRNKSGCSRRRGGSARPYDVRPCVLCRSNRPNSRAG
jgi:drug/metabolite transporter (DMT)-like permease